MSPAWTTSQLRYGGFEVVLWPGIEPGEGKGDEPRLDHLTA